MTPRTAGHLCGVCTIAALVAAATTIILAGVGEPVGAARCALAAGLLLVPPTTRILWRVFTDADGRHRTDVDPPVPAVLADATQAAAPAQPDRYETPAAPAA